MREMEDERMFVRKGNDECVPVSVIQYDVTARTNVDECHTSDYGLKETSDKTKLTKTSPVKESSNKDIRDVGYTKTNQPVGKVLHVKKNGPANGFLSSIPAVTENRTSDENILEKAFSTSLKPSPCQCDLPRSVIKNVSSKQQSVNRFRVFRISPKPFVPDPTVNRNAARPPVPTNLVGRGHACRANSITHNINCINSPLQPVKDSVFIERPLISDNSTLKEQTRPTSQSFCRDNILCKANIAGNRTDKKIDSTLYTTSPIVDITSGERLTHIVTGLRNVGVEKDTSSVTDDTRVNLISANSNNTSFEAEDLSYIDQNESTVRSRMGNTPSRRPQNKDVIDNIGNSKYSSSTEPPPSTNENVDQQKENLGIKSPNCTIPALIVSDSSLDQDMKDVSLKDRDNLNEKTEYTVVRPNIDTLVEETPVVVAGAKPLLRPYKSSDSAYSSDSRCTSMDSASDPTGRMGDSEFCDQDTSTSLLSPDAKSSDPKSISSSSSSSSSSPSHSALATSVTSNDSTLRVMSDYGLQRKLSSSSGSSFRSSLSFEESEDDMLSSDGEFRDHAVGRGRRQSKAQSSWTKIRRMVIWSPFMQSFKKKYPWVQLAGHAGNFQPGEEGCILKKYCSREAECLSKLSTDDELRPFAPEYHGIVEKEGERYTRMQDLLLAYDCPSVMDCKMGVRTYLEDELVKAKIKPRLRHDMYAKMTEIAPEEPTPEEHEQKAVTKPRYMQWREHVSSSSNLGFRIEGIKKADNEPSKDYKLTKTKEQVKNAFKYFIDHNIDVLEKYIKRLKDVRAAAEKSEFFMSHEVIGSSLLFVHDKTGIASAWMIDFGKTSQLPDNKKLSHREEWIEGNREDGYLFGLDNLIVIFEEILGELKITTKTTDDNTIQSTEVNDNIEPTPDESNSNDAQQRHNESPLTLTLSSQSSAESADSTATAPSDGPASLALLTNNNVQENIRKPPLKRQTASSEDDDTYLSNATTNHLVNDVTNDTNKVDSVITNDSTATENSDKKQESHSDESRGPGTT